MTSAEAPRSGIRTNAIWYLKTIVPFGALLGPSAQTPEGSLLQFHEDDDFVVSGERWPNVIANRGEEVRSRWTVLSDGRAPQLMVAGTYLLDGTVQQGTIVASAVGGVSLTDTHLRFTLHKEGGRRGTRLMGGYDSRKLVPLKPDLLYTACIRYDEIEEISCSKGRLIVGNSVGALDLPGRALAIDIAESEVGPMAALGAELMSRLISHATAAGGPRAAVAQGIAATDYALAMSGRQPAEYRFVS